MQFRYKFQYKYSESDRSTYSLLPDAVTVSYYIARQVEGKIAYRRAIKMAIANTMRMGAEGIKIQISGRLNGAEMARSEMYKEGRTPLHTFRADIDYCHAEALTKVGLLGIKVWICRGEVFGKRELAPNFTQSKESGRGNNGGNNGGKNIKGKKTNRKPNMNYTKLYYNRKRQK